MSSLDSSDLDRLEALAAAASPGPWFRVILNDAVCMSAVGLALEDLDDRDDNLFNELWPSEQIVAATLIQYPDLVNTLDRRWDANALFIAAARNAFDELVKLARVGLASVKVAGK